ncbi:aminoglycoside phosphotransferase family protein [Streptomyces sp. NPDC048338]|uniref:aminoglycoside phosphotransferase family protein n=1 Tax=Streptomyces sp. NPDC048338 TaxID=3365536 RepID=UPI003715B3DD
MLLPPDHVDSEELRIAVEAGYGRSVGSLEFQPLGEDSWAFVADDLWISVRRDLRGHVPGAYEAAALLRDAGLDRVLAPLTGTDGSVVRTVNGSPVVVFPRVDAAQTDPGTVSEEEFDAIVGMIGRLHTVRVPADLPAEDFSLSFAADLEAALDFADGPGPSGGLPARLHRLLADHRADLEELCAERGELAARHGSDRGLAEGFGLTHGEPSAPNVLRAADGFLLADWGGAMWGPPERDWFHVRRTFGRAPHCRPEVLRFYEVRWILSEISEYATILRDAPAENLETSAMWRRLTRYLPEA